jgi:hypothetical protein
LHSILKEIEIATFTNIIDIWRGTLRIVTQVRTTKKLNIVFEKTTKQPLDARLNSTYSLYQTPCDRDEGCPQ